MPVSTMMLVSADQALIASVRGATNALKNVDLEVVPEFDEACERVERCGLVLVLAHLSQDCSIAKLTRLLGTLGATTQKVPTLVLSDDYYAEQALAMLRLGRGGLPDPPAGPCPAGVPCRHLDRGSQRGCVPAGAGLRAGSAGLAPGRRRFVLLPGQHQDGADDGAGPPHCPPGHDYPLGRRDGDGQDAIWPA